MPAALQLRGIGKCYAGRWVVQDVTLHVARGAIVGILGENGAGKSTLIRACAGWLAPERGCVEIHGRIMNDAALATRAAIGIVSRDAPSYAFLAVREMVLLQAGLQGLSAAAGTDACARVLAACQLETCAAQRIGTLSSGLYQRVLLACALVHQPSVLLLDEPTTGLDPMMRQQVWHMLRAEAARGCAVLLTTHYLEEAAYVCDSVHVLQRGLLVQTIAAGAPGALLTALQQWVARATPVEAGA
jgi:ABC-2 type transport system ATP-binding protein